MYMHTTTRAIAAKLVLCIAIGQRLTFHHSLSLFRFDILIQMENAIRIILFLDLRQSLIVRPVRRRNAIALVFSHEVDVSAAGGIRRRGFEKLPRPRNAA